MVSRIHGVDPAKARTGAPIAEFTRSVHPEDRERVESAINQALTTFEDFSAEYRVIQTDQSVRWVSAVGRCSLGPDNAPARFPGLTVDITAQKQIEEALLQSEKLAVVGRLAASIAHEINNPLESVTNLLYLARGVNDTPMIDEYLETADRELRRVAAITSQTLRFHKQSTKPLELTGEQLIESVLSMFQGRIINSNIRVEKQIRSRAAVRCFEGEIRQVISNLVANALDAMYPSGGRLELRAREGRDQRTGRAGLIFSVADTGPGMPEAVADQAFQPFFTTKGLLGTGLGLWISREIVERHSGRLLLRTSQREGHTGTVISLFLPFDAISR
jgi:two-component system, sporulation sensor kinase E